MSGFIRRFQANVDDDDEEGGEKEEDSLATREKKEKKRRPLFFGYKRGVIRVKSVVLFPFKKLQKPFRRNRSRRSSSFAHVHSSSTSNLPTTSTKFGACFCGLCMSQPQTMDDRTGVDSPQEKSDSNDPETSIAALKVLIEKNDFYAKECNTHLSN